MKKYNEGEKHNIYILKEQIFIADWLNCKHFTSDKKP